MSQTYEVKLIKGISYNGIISATKKKPLVSGLDKETADKAVKTGYFAVVNTTTSDDASGEKSLDDMTVKELIAYAKENDIDISGLSKKGEILSKIKEVEEDGEPDFTQGE